MQGLNIPSGKQIIIFICVVLVVGIAIGYGISCLF